MNHKHSHGKNLNIILHVLAWAILLIIPLFILYAYGNADIKKLGHPYVSMLGYLVIFYANHFWLIPRFYFKNKKKLYFLLAVLLVVIIWGGLLYVNSYVLPKFNPERGNFDELFRQLEESGRISRPPKHFRLLNYIFTSILITGFSFGLRIYNRYEETEKKSKELEKEKLNSELAFLKNQISPHFFFNTLNNIYSLIEIDPPGAQESVLKLSKLMRYLLYESEHGKVTLSSEIAFMKNYIALMKLRFSEKVELSVDFPDNFRDREIPPLLFIPFIENAFKHGIDYRAGSYILISMDMNDHEIHFQCKNSIGKSSYDGDGQYSGIGLDNIKKRLALLYPQMHTLKIEQTPEFFHVDLILHMQTAIA